MVDGRVGTKQSLGTAKSRACMIQVSHLFPSLFPSFPHVLQESVYKVKNKNCGSAMYGFQSCPCNCAQVTYPLCVSDSSVEEFHPQSGNDDSSNSWNWIVLNIR